ncbi:amidohydrolase family protein [Pseudonocardia sp. NPDC049635]|uniref:amidohydrolase family protein n=1 Tax=Pseudonocardia sp. NPDC049635 TaxID=3155506 RepID=UPI0033F6D8A6
MQDKIALEEHLSTRENGQYWDDSGEAARNGQAYMAEVARRLLDVDDRIEAMDRAGVAVSVLSLTSPGVQGITDPQVASTVARHTNDTIHDTFVHRHPSRFAFFATVAVQDPHAGAVELQRAVTELGAKGALVNGYTDLPDGGVRYLDHPSCEPFWDMAAELGVPVYLHPREPHPGSRGIYEGYESLVGSAWGFGHETATHAVRLMLSGLFDRRPGLQVVLGHLGEALPFLLPRLEHRLHKQREGTGLGSAKRTVTEYFTSNIVLTTSGHFDTKALAYTISTIGSDRVLFSTDYPYETMDEAASWFDSAPLNRNDAARIGRLNAADLLRIPTA